MASSTSTVPAIVKATGFPTAQWQTLQQMAANNKLHGVPPEYLVAIWVAEGSNTVTNATNSAGYGGWFGTSNTGGNFQAQAADASQIYAAGLQQALSAQQTTGSPGQYAPVVAAENYYQTGQLNQASNGAGVFSQLIGENLLSGNAPTPDPGGAVGLSYIPGTPNFVGASSSQLQAISDCSQATILGQCSVGSSSGGANQPCNLFSLGPVGITKCQAKGFLSGLFVVGGAVLMLTGLALLFEGGKSAVGNAAQLGLNAVPGGVVVQQAVKRAGSKGAVPQQSNSDQRRYKAAQHAAAASKGQAASQRHPVGRNIPADAGGEDDF